MLLSRSILKHSTNQPSQSFKVAQLYVSYAIARLCGTLTLRISPPLKLITSKIEEYLQPDCLSILFKTTCEEKGVADQV